MERSEIIGIDHGWSMMKTVNYIFTSGVKEITTEPALYDNVLEYKGKYYKIGGNRMEVKPTKVTDMNYYILTLAAVAKELERRGLSSVNAVLAVGLPLTRFGAEKQDFIEYLTREQELSFRFEKKNYRLKIDKVSVFPQCYAAIADRISSFHRKALVIDIGSWTIDIMPIENKSPDESMCITKPKGLITCMRAINEQCVRQLNGEIEESDIMHIMMGGESEIEEPYQFIINQEIKSFAEMVYHTIGEYGYNLKTIPIIFVGGGAKVMKLFGNLNQNNISYIEDVRANAKGYEFLTKIALESRR